MLSFIGIIYSFYSVYLALISNFVIGSYCIMCIGLYLTNLLMGFYPWLIYNRFGTETFFTSLRIDLISLFKNKPFKNLLSGFMILIFVVLIFFPRYWETAFPGITAQVFTGTTEEGSPWIGAEHPELIIVEYTDYMCFQCKKMHFFLRNLVMEYPAKIRLVHRHFPLDKQVNPLVMKDFHPGSGVLSQIAIYAEKKHKFWQLNDYLYNLNLSHGAISLKKIALDNGFEFLVFKKGISSLETSQKLTLDIISALKKNISGTPSYIINGKKFTGQIPPEVLRPIIQ